MLKPNYYTYDNNFGSHPIWSNVFQHPGTQLPGISGIFQQLSSQTVVTGGTNHHSPVTPVQPIPTFLPMTRISHFELYLQETSLRNQKVNQIWSTHKPKKTSGRYVGPKNHPSQCQRWKSYPSVFFRIQSISWYVDYWRWVGVGVLPSEKARMKLNGSRQMRAWRVQFGQAQTKQSVNTILHIYSWKPWTLFPTQLLVGWWPDCKWHVECQLGSLFFWAFFTITKRRS